MQGSKTGFFITVEGGDGSGKSTQLSNICAYFDAHDIPYIFTREPGGTQIGEKIRQIILDNGNSEMCPMAEALLYAASRAQHVEQKIKPALAEGISVLCDRFVDSSIAYQGYGRELGESVKVINGYAIAGCIPDMTVFLDITPSKAMGRIGKRTLDRLETEGRSFHDKVYDGYVELIEEAKGKGSERFAIVDASLSENEVKKSIYAHLDRIFAGK